MSSYNTFVDYASAQPAWLPGELVEECFGKDAAKAGKVQRTAAGWLIKDGDYRPATTLEAAGIDGAMVKMAEALAHFAGYSEIEALEITLSGYEPVQPGSDAEWHAWLDKMADDWADTYAGARHGFALI
jgi:hypothetical protein